MQLLLPSLKEYKNKIQITVKNRRASRNLALNGLTTHYFINGKKNIILPFNFYNNLQ